MNNFCLCGCDQIVKTMRHGKPCLYVRGHNTTKTGITTDDYTYEYRGYKTECWVWKGKPNGAGYGRTQQNKKTVLAHRAVYELHMGPIPPGLELDHLCRVPICVNPDHLDPVTHLVNVRRGRAKSFSPEKVAEAQALRDSGMSVLAISKQMGHDWKTIRKHVTDQPSHR